jgi:hypothetical protein
MGRVACAATNAENEEAATCVANRGQLRGHALKAVDVETVRERCNLI